MLSRVYRTYNGHRVGRVERVPCLLLHCIALPYLAVALPCLEIILLNRSRYCMLDGGELADISFML